MMRAAATTASRNMAAHLGCPDRRCRYSAQDHEQGYDGSSFTHHGEILPGASMKLISGTHPVLMLKTPKARSGAIMCVVSESCQSN